MSRYIDAEKLKEHIYDLPKWKNEYGDEGEYWCENDDGNYYPDDVISSIDNQPTADVVEVVKGKWIKNKDSMGWHCSCCKKDNIYAYLIYDGEVANLQDYFCPNCGADMRGDTE